MQDAFVADDDAPISAKVSRQARMILAIRTVSLFYHTIGKNRCGMWREPTV